MLKLALTAIVTVLLVSFAVVAVLLVSFAGLQIVRFAKAFGLFLQRLAMMMVALALAIGIPYGFMNLFRWSQIATSSCSSMASTSSSR